MGLDKFSKQSDRIANLYRAAFHLAKGDKSTCLNFLKNSGSTLVDKVTDCPTSQNRLWAEKILDEYRLLLT
jgi:hypothetical protein